MAAKLRDRTPLPTRMFRIVEAVKQNHTAALLRFSEVVGAIAGADSLTAARTLASEAQDGMEAGTVAYYRVSILLSNPSVRGFCPECQAPLYGKDLTPRECTLETMGEDCEADG